MYTLFIMTNKINAANTARIEIREDLLQKALALTAASGCKNWREAVESILDSATRHHKLVDYSQSLNSVNYKFSRSL